MQIHRLKAKDVLNPFYLKKPILQEEFNSFVKALQDYKQGLETHQAQNEKSLVSNVLAPFLNTFGLNALSADKQKGNSEIDLSLNKEQKEVIIEAKKWGSKEFITPQNANTKAMREAILYFLRERELGNTALKFIVITDFYQFYIFKAKSFENFFYKNKIIQSLYKNFNKDSLLSTTSGFYEELEKVLDSKGFEAHIFRDKLFNSGGGASNLLHALYINLKPKLNPHTDFSKLKEFFKIFHKDFLFKEFNPNDANTLNDAFYKELLYILGLKEQKISSALLITKSEESNTQGTLYKGISDKLKNVEFESILSLIILWLNRILFLKLIEAKLISFNTKEKEASLKFLSYEKIGSFKKLSYLFFEVLAKPYKHRQEHKDFQALPYLNSSLFSKKDIENVLDISALDDDLELNFFEHTQIKDKYCNKKQGKTKLLEYLFAFLDSFDFGSYGEENTLIKQKELINSSVLGAVFEKLNGYKEGSFYTPSFITNYMCKQSLEKIVLEKFNTAFKFEAKNLESLKLELREKRKGLKLEELSKFKEQCKALLVSIRICDPAVGSGHFLVSALVSMIKIYDELSLFTQDFYTKSNQDELQVLSLNGEFIEYKKPKSLENNKAQLIQEELFNLKKSIIENNLFGVDINPNSCEITKLRLWIELLKHSFYLDTQSAFENLQTLPNIDINIKCGNSLISRFNLDSKISKTLEKQVEIYKKYVKWYKEPKEYELEIDIEKAKLKNQGQEFKSTKEMLEYQITTIKRTFTNNLKDPKTQEALTKKINEHFRNYGYFPEEESHWGEILLGLVGITRPLGLELSKDEAAFESYGKIRNLKAKLDYNESGEVYKDAFEWRFAFPEVLDSNGDFLGFDLIIGNPPYGNLNREETKPIIKKSYLNSHINEISSNFAELAHNLLKEKGSFIFVTNYAITFSLAQSSLRNLLYSNYKEINISSYDRDGCPQFDKMSQSVSILFAQSKQTNQKAIFKTSQFIRQKILHNEVTFEKVDNLLLSTKGLNNDFSQKHRLPKIGSNENLKLLEYLKDMPNVLGDLLSGDEPLYIRTSGNYWYNAFLALPYTSTEIKSYKVTYRNFIFCLINSNIYYWWLRIYGDGRHNNKDIMENFTLPDFKIIDKHKKIWDSLAKKHWENMMSVFNAKNNYFATSQIKHSVDLLDYHICSKVLGLDKETINYICDYDSNIRGGIQIKH